MLRRTLMFILILALMSQAPSAYAGSSACRWVWNGVAWVWVCQSSPAQPPKQPTVPSEVQCADWRTQLRNAKDREALALANIDQLDRAIIEISAEISIMSKARAAASVEVVAAQQALEQLEAKLAVALQRRDRQAVAALQPLLAAARTRMLNANNTFDRIHNALANAQKERNALLTQKDGWITALAQAKADQSRLNGLLAKCK
jgi:chromosome segregation ATPase